MKIYNFPFYRQLDANDCGPTCIRMICAYYHNKYSIEKIRELCHITRIGITIKDMTNALTQLGFNSFVIKVSPNQIKNMPTPTILYWRQQHFVILIGIIPQNGKNIYYIADPDYGKIKLTQSEFESNYFSKEKGQGIAILADPTSKFYQQKEQTTQFFQKIANVMPFLRKSLFKYQKTFICSLALILIASLANWGMPILLQHIIDNGINNKNMHIIYVLGIGQFLLFLSYIVSDSFSNILLTKSSFKIGITFLSDYLQKLIKLPLKFFDSKANSDLIQLIDDQEKLKSFLSHNCIHALLAFFNLVIFSGIILYYNSLVFCLFLFFATLSICWSIHFLKRKRDINYRRFSLLSEGKSHVYELIMGMREIKINSAQNKKIKEVENIQNKINLFQLKDLYINYYSNIGVSSFGKIKDILIIIFCAKLVIENQLTIGSMMSISYLLGQITAPLNQLISFALTGQEVKLSYERLQHIQTATEEPNVKNCIPITITNVNIGIIFKDIWFKYIGTYSPFVLKNINLVIPHGKITAIVGSSGSGKTTLLKLLLDFYPPNKGKITFNQIPFDRIDPDIWRKKCGVVMQDGYMFSGTIMDNIAISDESVDIQKVITAAKTACIHEFIEGLPLKYDTNIGNMGIELSGGQKQRLLIARAIYKNPEYIFLDEATSFLDASNEMQIMDNLNNFFIGRTVVIIAHRLSTVKNADNIIVLEHGEIVEQGKHDELIMKKGRYYQLIRNQLELGN